MAESGCLKDGHFQNLQVDGDTTINNLGYQLPVVSVTTATHAPSVLQSGTIYALDRPAGIAITLPAAKAGLVYEFHAVTTFTGTFQIDAASDADTLQGLIQMAPSALNDSDDNVENHGTSGPSAADHQYIADADTKGRLLGSHLTYKCITDSIWHVSGNVITTGVIATPFT